MQAGKETMASAKEAAANIGASAKSGMDKTKAVIQEKVDKMTSHIPEEKVAAEMRKEERIHQAEAAKHDAQAHNAAMRDHAGVPGAGGVTGLHQMSAMPGHGTGQPTGGHVVEGTYPSHPIGTATWTQRTSTAHNTHAGSTNPSSHGTGGTYS